MHRCESHEIAISSLIDGELDREQILRTLDHVLDCASCHTFFQQARALDQTLAPLRRRPVTAPRASAPRRVVRTWASWTAAVVAVLLVGLTVGRVGPPPASDPGARGPGGGKMSDDRFVAVATELLHADARDQIEMLQVLQHVQNYRTEESPGQTAALRTDVDLSSRWSQLPLAGETHPTPDVY